MPKINQSQHCSYPASQIFQLVSDIEQYPAFLPGCHSARILKKEPPKIVAELGIQKGPVQFSFSTENTEIEPSRIAMRLIEGPFEFLNGQWSFEQLETGSRVSLSLEFAMKNKLLQITMGPIFQKLTDDMLKSFLRRATEIYGPQDVEL